MVQKPTEADWILKAMVAVAAADGRLNAPEVGLIQKVYQELTGRSVDVSGVVLAVQAYATKRDVLVELSVAAGSISRETKEDIIRAAYRTLLVDKRIAEEERKRLKDIAAALQISEIHFEAILDSAGRTPGEDSSGRSLRVRSRHSLRPTRCLLCARSGRRLKPSVCAEDPNIGSFLSG